MSPEKINGREY